jgi:hypothetical protein
MITSAHSDINAVNFGVRAPARVCRAEGHNRLWQRKPIKKARESAIIHVSPRPLPTQKADFLAGPLLGYRLLAIGYWLLAIGYWLIAIPELFIEARSACAFSVPQLR